MKTQFTTRLATAVLVLGVLGACGGGSDTEDPEPTDSATTESETTEAAGDVDAFCAAFIELSKEGDDSISAEQGVEEIATLADTAPEEVAADVEVLDTSYQALIDAIEEAGLDVSVLDDGTQLTDEQQSQIQAAAEANGYDEAGSATAIDNVETWAADNCEGFEPDEEETTAPSTAPAGDAEAFCGAYDQLQGDIKAADSVPQLDILVASAPPELSADAQTIQSGILAYVNAVEAAGFDVSVLDDQSGLSKREQAAYNAALKAANVDIAAAETAANNIQAWTAANC